MSSPAILSSTSEHDVATTCATFALTSAEFHALRERAVAAKARAYCPYSRFRVGAALLTKSSGAEEHHIVIGANIENASYPVTTCAERVALGTAVIEGLHEVAGGGGFSALALATDIVPPASPCGMCRQFIREFCDLKMPIIMFDKDERYSVLRLEELLPLSFGPEALGAPEPSKQVFPK
ncbi:hypothetical protein VTI74DRAFT_10458 [Chaetomium olivicolor]